MSDYKRGKRRIEFDVEVTCRYHYVFEADEYATSSDENLLDRVTRYARGVHTMGAKLNGLLPLVTDVTRSVQERDRDPATVSNIVIREERWHERRIPGSTAG